MARHLTDKDIADVVEILDEWPVDAKLSWDRLVEAVEHDLKFQTTRQTLQKQVRIKSAFGEVKAIVSGRTTNKDKISLPPSLRIASERLEKKDREITRLKRENQQLLEQFHVWLYNASRMNVRIEELNTPLPEKYR
ncbi:hypothetical protein L5M11_21420 [Shewanella sp. SM87]|jgi:predicted nuclease with TOPRIM domain|uniref:hypothetical protein n=1 Tax=Shewanella sp. SM87 TaxID=2912808 RepID=UPI0021DA2522|nr:hypothetical protein [Shewanella sp. SM87]MCU8010054.1 hypothetical protein [Shewanella sp. SM87]